MDEKEINIPNVSLKGKLNRQKGKKKPNSLGTDKNPKLMVEIENNDHAIYKMSA